MMKPHYLVTFLVIILVVPCVGQNRTIDSLRSVLAKEPAAQDKVGIYSAMGNYFIRTQVYHDSAFFYTERAYDLAKQEGMAFDEAKALFDLGRIHNFLKDSEKAIAYYKRSLEVTKTLNRPQSLSSVYNNIGGAYFELEQFGDAIEYYEKALDISLTEGDARHIAVDYMNIAEAEYKLGDLYASKKHFELSKRQLDNINWEPSTFFLFYSRTLFALNDIEAAKVSVDKALSISEEQGDMYMISQSSELRSQIAELEKDYESAIGFYEKHVRFRDSLNTAREVNAIDKLKLNFDLDKAEKELVFMNKRNTSLKIIYILSAAGLLLLLVLISRQRKIIAMTRQMRDAQKALVDSKIGHIVVNDKNTTAENTQDHE
ncbi:MAG: tetratricopeptide repeat protein [Bacteroidota bacterium]